MHAVFVEEGEELCLLGAVEGGHHVVGVDEDADDAGELDGAADLRVPVTHHLLHDQVHQQLVLRKRQARLCVKTDECDHHSGC